MPRVHRRLRAAPVLAGGVLAVLLLPGCGADDALAGFGLPTLTADDAAASLATDVAQARKVEGTLAVEANGCVTWRSDDDADGAWVVWPEGTQQDEDRVILSNGRQVAGGDVLRGEGAAVPLTALPDGGAADSYFASFGGFCDAGTRGVLVILVADRVPE